MTTAVDTGLEASLGMLSLAAVASQLSPALPVWARTVSDQTIFVRRLIARESLPLTRIGFDERVAIEALRDFMRDPAKANLRASAGLPPETLTPIIPFPALNDVLGFVVPDLSFLRQAVTAELQRQMPEVANEPAAGQTFTVIQAQMTPALKAIFSGPLPGMGFDTSGFRNSGELFLVWRLQNFCMQDVQAASSRTGGSCGVAGLYASPEAYAGFVRSATQTLQTFAESLLVTGSARVAGSPSVWRGGDGGAMAGSWTKVKIVLSDRQIMEAVGTNTDRLAALAF